MTRNTSFSIHTPNLQLFVDSTSLGDAKTCAQLYDYHIRQGYVPKSGTESVHLKWGLEYHAGLELYDRQRAQGLPHHRAQFDAVKYVILATWDFKLKRPWTGSEREPTKTRETLLRAVVWYTEQFKHDPLETLILSNGKPAVELSFRFDSGITTQTKVLKCEACDGVGCEICQGLGRVGESFILCGHLDKCVLLHGERATVDKKSTKGPLDDDFFVKFDLDNQMALYDAADQVVFPEPVEHIIIDGVQTGATFARFRRGFVTRSQARRDEWLRDLEYWLHQMELWAVSNHYPKNEKSCVRYGRKCEFFDVCRSDPHTRQLQLDNYFDKRMWNPLETREV